MAQKVQAPARQPRAGGIRSVVPDFIPEARLTIAQGAQGGIAYEDATCAKPSRTRAGCFDETDNDALDDDKESTGVGQYTSILEAPFALYKGVECFIGGDDEDQTFEEAARRGLEGWEDREVEAELWAWALGASTSGTAANISLAIGAAEKYADANYIGRPVLIMSRGLAAKADLSLKDGTLWTINGNPVISTGVVDDADDTTVVAIGMPAVYAGEARAYPTMERSKNIARAIAERVYDIAVDCDFRHIVTVATPLQPSERIGQWRTFPRGMN